jgi:hypothetical protein
VATAKTRQARTAMRRMDPDLVLAAEVSVGAGFKRLAREA